MSIDWNEYYKNEAEISDFNPQTDVNEIHRCLAAYSVIPAGYHLHILDAGCGDGYFCHWIKGKRKDINVQGLDISGPRLERARARYDSIKFYEGMLPYMPFENNSYDLVSCIEVLEHMSDPVVCLRELARVSRQYVLITVPDREKLRSVLCPHCLKKFPENGHLHSFDQNNLHRILKKANLKLIKSEIYYPPVGSTYSRIPYVLGKALRKIYNLIDLQTGAYIAVLATKLN